MIDFRYHLVSLAAVLIALSVGIVLGAGPLNDDIGNTLNSEVTRLRGEKEDLRRQLGDAEAGAEARDTYDESTLEQVVAGRLDGHRVAVVVLPQADGQVAESMAETLEQAGAEVREPVELDPSWVSTEEGADSERSAVGDDALADLGAPTAGSGSSIDRALGVILTGQVERGGESVSEDARSAAWDRLVDADLVGGPNDPPTTADLVVVIAAPVAAETAEDDAETVAREAAEGWVRLARALDRASSGAVLAGSQSDVGSDQDVSVVSAARDSTDLARGVSTVDAPEIPMGRAGVILALREQIDGESGHYGLGPDAASAVPDVS